MIYTHPGQPQMQVEVILASRPTNGAPPIYTIRLRYPRIIHAELMTHRVFSRNARSSRAVPVKTMLMETTTIPFVPWHWFKNQPGMQGRIRLTDEEIVEAKRLWLEPLPAVVAAVSTMMDPDDLNIHKQNPNRLLESWLWIDVLITSTEWENFLWLRDHEAAEPHLQDLARLVQHAIDNAEFQSLEPGQWHLPYITEEDWDQIWHMIDQGELQGGGDNPCPAYLCKISAARCARISYKPFDGDASYKRELERYDSLVKSDRVHASPLEHQATPDKLIDEAYRYRPTGVVIDNKVGFERKLQKDWACAHLSGNLGPGWIQFRKTVPNENHTSRA